MATGTWKWYGNGLKHFFNKAIDWDTDAGIKIALTTSTYVPDQDAHDFFNDVTNEVANGNGYTSGGQALAGKSLTYTGGTNVLKLDATDAQWTNATFTARVAVIYLDTADPATSPLIGYCVFDGDVSPSAGTLDITFSVDGILKVTAAA
jgi:hypothetical protein